MSDKIDACRAFASLALFRKIYGEGRYDIYGIVSVFIKNLIACKGMHSFDLIEITRELNDEYDFRIPDAVVRPALDRIAEVKKDKGMYHVSSIKTLGNPKFKDEHQKLEVENNKILRDLYEFVETQIGCFLSQNQKESVKSTFCSYLLDDKDGHEFSEYVSAFILDRSSDVSFAQSLNTIREGVILNTGIRYTPKLNEPSTWTRNLDVYLDTEIIFNIAGYNGEIYKQITHEFLELVNDVNRNSNTKDNSKTISLFIFHDTKEEINEFFSVAEKIIDGQSGFMSDKQAMDTIIRGCTSGADVVQKREALFQKLRPLGIELAARVDFYADEYREYNIESTQLIEELSASYNRPDLYRGAAEKSLAKINYINILRKGQVYQLLEDCRAIFVTNTSLTQKFGNDKRVRHSGTPLAVGESWLINRLWFKLNKGFGTTTTPKSFDVLTKAQIVLASQLADSIASDYQTIKDQFKNGDISKETAVATIINLRNRLRKPEDIKTDDIESILRDISERDITVAREENSHLRKELEKATNQIIELKSVVTEKELQLEKRNQEIAEEQVSIRQHIEKINSTHQQELNNQNKSIEEMKQALAVLEEDKKENEYQKKVKRHKIVKIMLVLVMLLLVATSVLLFFWKQEILSFIFGIFGILSFIYTVGKGFLRSPERETVNKA